MPLGEGVRLAYPALMDRRRPFLPGEKPMPSRTLRERIAQVKARPGMPPVEQLLTESHAARSYRKAIETLARLETEEAARAPKQRTTTPEERRAVHKRARRLAGLDK